MPLKGVVVYKFTITQGFDRVYRLPLVSMVKTLTARVRDTSARRRLIG